MQGCGVRAEEGDTVRRDSGEVVYYLLAEFSREHGGFVEFCCGGVGLGYLAVCGSVECGGGGVVEGGREGGGGWKGKRWVCTRAQCRLVQAQ